MTITPEWAEVISEAIDDRLIDVHTGLPGTVQKFNNAGTKLQTADVELQLQRLIPKTTPGEYLAENLPVLQNIPVGIYRNNTHFYYLPTAVGDTGHVQFTEMSMDSWLSKGVVSNPGDVGRHTLTGGIFYPNLTPVPARLNPAHIAGSDAIIGAVNGVQMRVKTTTIEFVNVPTVPAASFVALATLVDLFIATFDTVMRTAWTPVGQDGGAALKAAYVAAFVAPPNSVASTNLKAD